MAIAGNTVGHQWVSVRYTDKSNDSEAELLSVNHNIVRYPDRAPEAVTYLWRVLWAQNRQRIETRFEHFSDQSVPEIKIIL